MGEMNVTRTLDYKKFMRQKAFRIEPSRQGQAQVWDAEQMRVFIARQKRLPELWREMGIVGIKTNASNKVKD